MLRLLEAVEPARDVGDVRAWAALSEAAEVLVEQPPVGALGPPGQALELALVESGHLEEHGHIAAVGVPLRQAEANRSVQGVSEAAVGSAPRTKAERAGQFLVGDRRRRLLLPERREPAEQHRAARSEHWSPALLDVRMAQVEANPLDLRVRMTGRVQAQQLVTFHDDLGRVDASIAARPDIEGRSSIYASRMSEASEDPIARLLQPSSEAIDIDKRRAAEHEGAHLLALGSRGFFVGDVSIADSGASVAYQRWTGGTHYERPDAATVQAEAEAALAGVAAEFAAAGNANFPSLTNKDVRDSALLFWCDVEDAQRSDDDDERAIQADAALSHVEVMKAVGEAWRLVFPEMQGLLPEIKAVAEAILEADDYHLAPEVAAALASELLGVEVKPMAASES